MSKAPQSLADRRILVVEDEYLIASQVKRWLQAAGSVVVGPVPSVDQALDLIEDSAPDAVVLDINLGDGDTAYPVADRLSALGIPFLFATGDVQVSNSSVHASQPRLQKPFLEAELVLALTKLVR